MKRDGAEQPFIHRLALCESDDVGQRTRVWAFAQVMAGARIGADCNICGHAFIEAGSVIGNRVTVKNAALIWDGVTLEDDVFIGPGAVFTNDINPRAAEKKPRDEFLPTHVRRGASIGANATIVCGVTIGQHAFIGAGAVVRVDVGAHALVVGNPSRHVGWVCACGDRLDQQLRCRCGRAYEKLDEARGLTATGA